MIALHPQFVTDERGTRLAVMLPAKEYDSLLEELEQAEDMIAYDQAKAAGGETIPWDHVKADLARLP
jgi:hypothetical protein